MMTRAFSATPPPPPRQGGRPQTDRQHQQRGPGDVEPETVVPRVVDELDVAGALGERHEDQRLIAAQDLAWPTVHGRPPVFVPVFGDEEVAPGLRSGLDRDAHLPRLPGLNRGFRSARLRETGP